MAYRPVPFAPGEWFHCYSRTVDGSKPFEEVAVRERFLELLYLANQHTFTPAIMRSGSKNTHETIFRLNRTEPLVAIAGYCLMPNHYHLLMQSLVDDGISRLMQRLGTGITHFYNLKHKRVGNLFIKPFRAKHLYDDRYFRQVAHYIHLNPLDLLEPQWKTTRTDTLTKLAHRLYEYSHSSLVDYRKRGRPQSNLLHRPSMHLIGQTTSLNETLIRDAIAYHGSLDLLAQKSAQH